MWQVTSDPVNFPEGHEIAEHVRIEYVVVVEGTVRLRPKEVVNSRMATGAVEVRFQNLQFWTGWYQFREANVLNPHLSN